jgi:hypothetical protein
MTPPLELYKYLSLDRAQQVLGSLRIRFSQVSVLNDIDEFQPPYRGMGTREVIEEKTKQRFEETHPADIQQLYSVLPKDKADELLAEMVSEWAETIEANFEKNVQALYAKLDENFGLLSLSANPTNALMWAFYSDGGRGIAIEFDSQHPWFDARRGSTDSFRHLRPVHYLADRNPDYFLTATDDDVLYTKLEAWRFESEWRIIRNFNDAAVKVGPDLYGKDVLLFDIPADAIKAILIGYRTSEAQEIALRSLVQNETSLKHVVFKRIVRESNGHLQVQVLSDHLN